MSLDTIKKELEREMEKEERKLLRENCRLVIYCGDKQIVEEGQLWLEGSMIVKYKPYVQSNPKSDDKQFNSRVIGVNNEMFGFNMKKGHDILGMGREMLYKESDVGREKVIANLMLILAIYTILLSGLILGFIKWGLNSFTLGLMIGGIIIGAYLNDQYGKVKTVISYNCSCLLPEKLHKNPNEHWGLVTNSPVYDLKEQLRDLGELNLIDGFKEFANSLNEHNREELISSRKRETLAKALALAQSRETVEIGAVMVASAFPKQQEYESFLLKRIIEVAFFIFIVILAIRLFS